MTRSALAHWLPLALLLASASAAHAQAPPRPGAARDAEADASPLLPPGHWALTAARRAEAMGLLPDPLPAGAPLSRRSVGLALRRAAESADSAAPALHAVADGWRARFEAEFPETVDTAGPGAGVRLLGSAGEAGYARVRGRAGPGTGEGVIQTGAAALPDRSEAVLELDLAAAAGEHLAASLVPRVDARPGVDRWDLLLAGRGARVAVGRQPVRYGRAVGGGVVMGGSEPLDRVEVATEGAAALPGWLRLLGPVSFHTFVALLPEERHPEGPVLWGASGSLHPHPRLQLSVHRGAMIGGDGVADAVTPRTLLLMLVGKHAEIENQIVSGEVRYRLPTERWLPLTASCEFGAEDSAGAVTAVPGLVCGGEVAALPQAPGWGAGVEYALFGARCCGNPAWYRHGMFVGGWSAADAPLGHPLGGQGSEWLAHVEWSSPSLGLEVEGRGFVRERAGENLYVPGRAGRSRGAAATLDWRAAPRATVRLEARVEDGADWAEHHLRLGARVHFD